MKKWSHEVVIHAPIEDVWKVFDGSLEETQRIMPNIVSIEPIKETEDKVGSVYRQIFRNRNAVQEYEVETVEYEDTSTYKKLKTSFTIPRMLDITNVYELKQLDDGKTQFFNETTNIPLRWDMKILLFFAGKKPVVDLVERVRIAAETTYREHFT